MGRKNVQKIIGIEAKGKLQERGRKLKTKEKAVHKD